MLQFSSHHSDSSWVNIAVQKEGENRLDSVLTWNIPDTSFDRF